MTNRLMFTINAIVVALFGAVFLVRPEFALTLLDTETYASTLFAARFLGGVLLLAGILIWLAKDINNAGAEKTMVIVLLASSVIGFILTLVGMVSVNVIRENGWVLLVVHIIFVLGYGFLLSGVSVVSNNQQQFRQSQ